MNQFRYRRCAVDLPCFYNPIINGEHGVGINDNGRAEPQPKAVKNLYTESVFVTLNEVWHHPIEPCHEKGRQTRFNQFHEQQGHYYAGNHVRKHIDNTNDSVTKFLFIQVITKQNIQRHTYKPRNEEHTEVIKERNLNQVCIYTHKDVIEIFQSNKIRASVRSKGFKRHHDIIEIGINEENQKLRKRINQHQRNK